MRIFKKVKDIEDEEDLFNNLVNQLEKSDRIEFFREKNEITKDPDTYATINWLFFLGGLHHLYLKEYKTFLIEFFFIFIAIVLFFSELQPLGVLLFLLVHLYEFPNLFASQKIVRMKNLENSKKIYEKMKKRGFRDKAKEKEEVKVSIIENS